MKPPHRSSRGFSMTEMLAVLAIIAILSIASVYMIRPRTSDSVRSLMSDIEGLLVNTQNSSLLSVQDIYLSGTGDWVAGTLVIDGRPLATTTTLPSASNSVILNRVGATSETFKSLYTQGVWSHRKAGVDTTGAWYTTALGSAADLKTKPPFSTVPAFLTAFNNPLCVSGSTNWVAFNGVGRQYTAGFSITIVGLNNGSAVKNGPIGVIVVPAGASTIYKFFKPDQSSTWGRM